MIEGTYGRRTLITALGVLAVATTDLQGQLGTCPWDCGDPLPDTTVGIVDFLTLLGQWEMVDTPCDFDGGGVGITDLLMLLANWGPCPGTQQCFGQPRNQLNGIFSDVDCDACIAQGDPPTQTVADQLTLLTAESLHILKFWGGYFPGDAGGADPLPDEFSVKFRINDDSMGSDQPGPVIRKVLVGPATTRIETGVMLFGVREFEYTIELASNQDLAPGVYWVEIYNDTASDQTGDDWFWETGDLDVVNGLPGFAYTVDPPNAPAKGWMIDDINDLSLTIICTTG